MQQADVKAQAVPPIGEVEQITTGHVGKWQSQTFVWEQGVDGCWYAHPAEHLSCDDGPPEQVKYKVMERREPEPSQQEHPGRMQGRKP
jgi:hypothetical protein